MGEGFKDTGNNPNDLGRGMGIDSLDSKPGADIVEGIVISNGEGPTPPTKPSQTTPPRLPNPMNQDPTIPSGLNLTQEKLQYETYDDAHKDLFILEDALHRAKNQKEVDRLVDLIKNFTRNKISIDDDVLGNSPLRRGLQEDAHLALDVYNAKENGDYFIGEDTITNVVAEFDNGAASQDKTKMKRSLQRLEWIEKSKDENLKNKASEQRKLKKSRLQFL